MKKDLLRFVLYVMVMGSMVQGMRAMDADNTRSGDASQSSKMPNFHEGIEELGKLLEEIQPLYEKVKPYIDSSYYWPSPYEGCKNDLDELKDQSTTYTTDLHRTLSDVAKVISKDRSSLVSHLKSIEKSKAFTYKQNNCPIEKNTDKNSSDYNNMKNFIQKLENLYNKVIFCDVSIRESEKDRGSDYPENLDNAVIKNLLEELGGREAQVQTIENQRNATFFQRNWSIFGVAVLGALLLEALREKSFVRGGAQALWRKAKSFFRKKPSQESREKSKALLTPVKSK